MADTALDNKPRLFMTLSVVTFYVQTSNCVLFIIKYKAWNGGFYINIMLPIDFLTEATMAVLSFV